MPEPMSTITLVRRADWDADMQDGEIPPLALPATNVYFTYSNTEQCSNNSNTLPSCHHVVKLIQQRSLYDYNLPDIPYNFLLGGDGCVYEGRGWRLKPEPIPDEPELNARNTLVVAYIGKKEDPIPKYRKKLLNKLELGFMKYCIEQGQVENNADKFYAQHTPKYPSAAIDESTIKRLEAEEAGEAEGEEGDDDNGGYNDDDDGGGGGYEDDKFKIEEDLDNDDDDDDVKNDYRKIKKKERSIKRRRKKVEDFEDEDLLIDDF